MKALMSKEIRELLKGKNLPPLTILRSRREVTIDNITYTVTQVGRNPR